MSDIRAEFEALVANLAEFFARDTMAVSVNTEKFGTLSRADVARLSATIARQGAARAVTQALMAMPSKVPDQRQMGADFEHGGWVN
jgi:hypothetical protein